MRPTLRIVSALAVLALPGAVVRAQSAVITQERQEFARWLASDPLSPFAALANQPVEGAVTLGPPDADIPLTGLAKQTVRITSGRVALEGPGTPRVMPWDQAVPVPPFRLRVVGLRSRPALLVYGPIHGAPHAAWFPEDAGAVQDVVVAPPSRPATITITGLDGIETAATEAGTVTLTSGQTLRVRRVATGPDEQELQLYFRDATSGNGTYPAGRFVTLSPLGGPRYRLDWNQARNPFCAYNTVFPCPAPWPGNSLSVPINAGERYPK
jgi:hypothetical protein